MALSKSRLRSELANTTETDRLLNKIAALLAQSARHVVFQKGTARFSAANCTNVAIDETLDEDNIQFQRPGGSAVEYYDTADIQLIKRLRTKKWLIKIKASADDASAA